MRCAILSAKADGDSVGGVIECAAVGVPAGWGDPMFGGMENRISQAIFAIPAVKSLEFGAGAAVAKLRGSENNDPWQMASGRVVSATNHHGGLLGGITTGMPVILRSAVKPTPSIAAEQRSVSLSQGQNTTLQIKGRHDPCIVPRAVPVFEAALAVALYDAYLCSL
jgi:chorismate synthase